MRPPSIRFTYAKQRLLILRFYHPVASIVVPTELLDDKEFFNPGKAAVALRAWKLQMAAYIIMRFLVDITGSIGNDATLDSLKYQNHSKAVYYCLIVPVAHTMVMMMDKEAATTLSVSGILGALPGVWYKKIRTQIGAYGCWSPEGLKAQKESDEPRAKKHKMACGVHHTVFRVLYLLSLDKDKVGGLTGDKKWITQEQSNNLYLDYDGDVRMLEKVRTTM